MTETAMDKPLQSQDNPLKCVPSTDFMTPIGAVMTEKKKAEKK